LTEGFCRFAERGWARLPIGPSLGLATRQQPPRWTEKLRR
jgi:hypothetical protein